MYNDGLRARRVGFDSRQDQVISPLLSVKTGSGDDVKNGGSVHPFSHMSSWHNNSLIKHRNNSILPSLTLTYTHLDIVWI
jgi:hypothetical protein